MSSTGREAGDVEAVPHHPRQRRGGTVGGEPWRRKRWAVGNGSTGATQRAPSPGSLCSKDRPPLTNGQKGEETGHRQEERRDDAAEETLPARRQRRGRTDGSELWRRRWALNGSSADSAGSPGWGFPCVRRPLTQRGAFVRDEKTRRFPSTRRARALDAPESLPRRGAPLRRAPEHDRDALRRGE